MAVDQVKGEYDVCSQVTSDADKIYVTLVDFETGRAVRIILTPKTADQLAKMIEYHASLVSGEIPMGGT